MSHNHLLDTYRYIEKRLVAANNTVDMSPNIYGEKKINEGRIDTLNEFAEFLHSNFDHKLPRRLYKKYRKSQAYR